MEGWLGVQCMPNGCLHWKIAYGELFRFVMEKKVYIISIIDTVIFFPKCQLSPNVYFFPFSIMERRKSLKMTEYYYDYYFFFCEIFEFVMIIPKLHDVNWLRKDWFWNWFWVWSAEDAHDDILLKIDCFFFFFTLKRGL